MRYKTLLLDPPWPSPSGRRNVDVPKERFGKLSLADIESMPLKPFTADQAHIYVWVMNVHAFEQCALNLMERNGFKFTNRIIWVKTSKAGTPAMALGAYYRLCYEQLFFGVKGNLPAQSHSLPNVLMAQRSKLAQKPDASYTMIEAMSPGPRLELYARRRMLGWHVWGNEADQDVDLNWRPQRELAGKGQRFKDEPY